jgi:hypothetical protein
MELLLFSGIRIRIVFGSWIRIRIRVKSWIRIRINVKNQELSRLKMKPWTLKMDAWRACRPVVADSHHLDKEKDRTTVNSRIRIRIKVMRICKPFRNNIRI